MSIKHLPPKDQFKGEQLNGWKLEYEKGRGKNGVVYYATSPMKEVAIKIIPKENLKDDWITEVNKVVKLTQIPQVIQYIDHKGVVLQNNLYACIISEYIRGYSLRDYIRQYPSNITLSFIENLTEQILRSFLAIKARGVIYHGDLHEGNIMIADPDEAIYEQKPMVKVGDFGIGGSHSLLKPKDDYVELARICYSLFEQFIGSKDVLDNTEDRRFYEYITTEFLPKKILETNPTVGSFVRNPRELIDILLLAKQAIKQETWKKPAVSLKHPFDYLSCEQIGDSFELLQNLYASNFPGYEDLLQKTNTILTGPRGCGKTTIFRNLSLKTQILAKKKTLQELDNYIGVYYHCRDLYFPFHYHRDNIKGDIREILLHYFNIALFRELIDTVRCTFVSDDRAWQNVKVELIENFLEECLPRYSRVPAGTDTLQHIMSFVEKERHLVERMLKKKQIDISTLSPLPMDFIPKLCTLLQGTIPWLKGRAIYFFLDDYSLPHISKDIQKSLHDIIMYRWPCCFFKISTESITTFFPYDSSGKLIEETREYDVVDIGAYFIRNSADSLQETAVRQTFLVDVINNRLKIADGIHDDYKDIRNILGPSPYKSYNDLAEQIRSKEKINYAGIKTIADLFSGDIADILRIVRSIFFEMGSYEVFSRPGLSLPIKSKEQDKAIRTYAASFLNRIEAAPDTGDKLRKIAEAFGYAANWALKNWNSKNVEQNPPKQALRIELLDRFSFNEKDNLNNIYLSIVPKEQRDKVSLDDFIKELKTTYNDLLRYGVFLRDVRGKSLRGAIVPRLYLRRLLVPTFLLTPNQRDNISLEVYEFFTLLYSPDKEQFLKIVKSKKKEEESEGQQKLL